MALSRQLLPRYQETREGQRGKPYTGCSRWSSLYGVPAWGIKDVPTYTTAWQSSWCSSRVQLRDSLEARRHRVSVSMPVGWHARECLPGSSEPQTVWRGLERSVSSSFRLQPRPADRERHKQAERMRRIEIGELQDLQFGRPEVSGCTGILPCHQPGPFAELAFTREAWYAGCAGSDLRCLPRAVVDLGFVQLRVFHHRKWPQSEPHTVIDTGRGE